MSFVIRAVERHTLTDVRTKSRTNHHTDPKELEGMTFFNGTPDTDGRSRVYGGDADLVHIKDGARAAFGRDVAQVISDMIRGQAVANGLKTEQEALSQNLCPGCYMIALYNAAIVLACSNGQSLSGLGHTMAKAFERLAQHADLGIANCREDIHVLID